ncbi:hypothetical protein Dda_6849 [Drechslerella dactyloides]|uniref:Uncharacterized protein n=1 Tax=Drechslerella dactyloides TaxID=74499 RepID=A0AAD6IWD6_DREDA|nr:hypothetical protein Dda_6849 [Drechslerella dactyloides]
MKHERVDGSLVSRDVWVTPGGPAVRFASQPRDTGEATRRNSAGEDGENEQTRKDGTAATAENAVLAASCRGARRAFFRGQQPAAPSRSIASHRSSGVSFSFSLDQESPSPNFGTGAFHNASRRRFRRLLRSLDLPQDSIFKTTIARSLAIGLPITLAPLPAALSCWPCPAAGPSFPPNLSALGI